MFTHFSGRTKQPAKCAAYFCALAILICLKFALNKQPKPKCDRKHTQTYTHTHKRSDCVCVPERKSGFKDLLHTHRENERESETEK